MELLEVVTYGEGVGSNEAADRNNNEMEKMNTKEIAEISAQLASGLRHHNYPAGSIAAMYAEGPAARAAGAKFVHDFRKAGRADATAFAKCLSRNLRG